MIFLQIIRMGLFYKHWTLYEAFVFFLSCVMKKLKVAPDFFNKYYQNVTHHAFKKKWLKNKNGEYYFDFKGALLPDVSINKNELIQLISCFDDVFLIPCFYNDNHDKTIIELLSRQFSKVYWEGPYGYKDGAFNVSVKRDDIVIDAGAWIGDFSAYAASKGAVVYAFEPIEDTFHWLSKTSDLNKGIHPIKKGLSDNEEELNVFIDKNYSAANSIVIERQEATVEEKIYITTIDKFVEKNNITRVDFIKADIEGAERNMLKGAAYVLKKFAPKLAICTYHLHDDPEVLEKIILEANPNYKIVHLEHKLFAAVC